MSKSIIALHSAARTATVNSNTIEVKKFNGAHVILDVTAVAATPSIVLKIQAQDPASEKWYDLLESAAVTGTGTNVYKVLGGVAATANVSVSDKIPEKIRIRVEHADADSITYSVGINLVDGSVY